MTLLLRTSNRFAFAGTLLLHGGALLLYLLAASQQLAPSLLLPPAAEAVRLSLTEAVPEPKAAPPAPPEPAPVPEPAPEPPAPVPLKKTLPPETPSLKSKPQKKKEAPPPRPEEIPSNPVPQAVAQDTAPQQTPALAEARQTLLSALIAGIEREKRYPPAARRLGLEGTVTVVVRLDEQGRIADIRVRGNPAHALLERATLETLERVQAKWRALPVPEPVTLTVPVLYVLKSS
jgi:protein TonB